MPSTSGPPSRSPTTTRMLAPSYSSLPRQLFTDPGGPVLRSLTTRLLSVLYEVLACACLLRLGEGQVADQAQGIEEVAEPHLGSQQEHPRKAHCQPPGSGGDVAGRSDDERHGDAEYGREQQTDRDHVPCGAQRGEQVPGEQALGRGLVAGEAKRE